ncbi:MAG: LuxR C-terminal-related transcriptional regulator, partial [Chloroflexi bacterium]|nr:LuxR C-terminal-related transcriptional regulator [Chloroflexota bacterium]
HRQITRCRPPLRPFEQHMLHKMRHTVKFHVSEILAKLNAESRTEAVAIAIRQGLVPL